MTTETQEEAFELFEEHRAAFLAGARALARAYCKEHGSATVDDIRTVLPPPAGIDGRVMGAVFRTSEFERVGYEASHRATCHKRPIARFRLAE